MEEIKDIQIKLVVNKKEHEQIINNANACGKTVSAYIRELALNMCLIEVDDSCVDRYTEQISAINNAIYQLVFTIKKMVNYTPADLEYILNKMDEILTFKDEFLDIFEKKVESEKKIIAKTVRQIVRKNIKEDE